MNTVELELLHRELDGENSPEESRRLHALLAENRDARMLYDELSIVDRGLKHTTMVEPPVWLRGNIMDALPADRRSEGFRLPTLLRNLWASMQARPALTYAYAFTIGILFGLGLFAVALQDAPATESELYGALVEDASGAEVLPIQLSGFKGKAEVVMSGRHLIVDLVVEADEKVDVRLVSDRSLMLRGFTRKADNVGTSIDIDNDAILLGIQGADRFAILFSHEESSDPYVRLEVRRDGRLLYEERLRAAES